MWLHYSATRLTVATQQTFLQVNQSESAKVFKGFVQLKHSQMEICRIILVFITNKSYTILEIRDSQNLAKLGVGVQLICREKAKAARKYQWSRFLL